MTDEPVTRSPIVPTLAAAHARGRDLVWCASLDLAFLELRALLGGAPVTLHHDAPSPAAAELVRGLNASPVTPEVADPSSYLACAGRHTEAWIRGVDAELRGRFGQGVDARLLDRAPRSEVITAYAFMSKAWRFATPLLRGHGLVLVDGLGVETFGLWETGSPADLHRARADQLLVHFHRFGSDDEPDDFPSEEFLVELVTQDTHDRFFVARLPPQPTLGATVQWALSRIRPDAASAPEARLTRQERVEVPCLDFDLTRRYGELEGQRVAGAGSASVSLGDVLERVRFRLDDGGAQLTSEARFGGLCLPPRNMVCSTPFLVLGVRRGASVPFLAAWLETALLLIATPPR